MHKGKKIFFCCFFVVVFSLLSCVAATIIIRYSGNIITLSENKELGDIFSQLKSSKILPAFPFPIIVYSLAVLLLKHNKNSYKSSKKIIVVLLFIITFFAITALTVLFSSVNGIRVINVLISLVKNLNNGLAKELAVTV